MGLELHHTKYDLYLTVMHGVAFEATYMLEDYILNGNPVNQVIILGGVSKSSLWTSILSCLVGCPVDVSEETDAGCIGAALLAGLSRREIKQKSESTKEISYLDDKSKLILLDKYNWYKASLKSYSEFYVER